MERRKLQTQEEVEKLLEKFMAGTTTLEEEAQLADFFRTHEVTGKLAIDKKMFALFDEGKVIVEEEKKSKVWWKYVSIAAIILLLLGLGFWMNGRFNKKPELVAQTDTIKTTPQVEEKKVEEQPESPTEQKEKTDSLNKVKEIQRIARPPKRYMAKMEKQEVQPEKKVQADTIIYTAPPYRIAAETLSEPPIQQRTVHTSTPQKQIDYEHLDYEEMKREIMQRGQRLMDIGGLAINNEEDF